MPTRSFELRARKLLLVEGKDEERFFTYLAQSLGIDKNEIDIHAYEGKDRFRTTLRGLQKQPAFPDLESLGIVRDADDSAADAFKSVCGALRNAKIEVPETRGVFVGGSFRVGILIVPPEREEGMLEDLCLSALDNHKAIPCVNQFCECLTASGIPIRNRAKTRLHAFLASREDPGLKLGQAVDAKYIPIDSPVFESVRDFLKAL